MRGCIPAYMGVRVCRCNQLGSYYNRLGKRLNNGNNRMEIRQIIFNQIYKHFKVFSENSCRLSVDGTIFMIHLWFSRSLFDRLHTELLSQCLIYLVNAYIERGF